MMSLPSLTLYSVVFLTVAGGFFSSPDSGFENVSLNDLDKLLDIVNDIWDYLSHPKELIQDVKSRVKDWDEELGVSAWIKNAIRNAGDGIRYPFEKGSEIIQNKIHDSIILGGSFGIEPGTPIQYLYTSAVIALGISSFGFFIWFVLSVKNLIL